MPVTVGTGQITLTDLNDAIISGSAPTTPTTGQIWIDESVTPNLVKKWNGSGWVVIGEISEEGTGDVIDVIETTLADFAADNKITRFERGTIRQALFEIHGKYMAPADPFPTLAQIDVDTYELGSLFAIRKAARSIGVSTAAGSAYTNLGTYYTALTTYLNGLTPKPWDTVSTVTNTVVQATWEQKWRDYYNGYALLEIAVQDRQKALAEAAESGAVAQVSNSVAKATVPITNPVTIDAPVATLGLPEFRGSHIDSWTWKGRNIIRNSNFSNGFVDWVGDAAGVTNEDGRPAYKIVGALGTTKTASQVIPNPKKSTKYSIYADIKALNYVAGTTNPFVALYIVYSNNSTYVSEHQPYRVTGSISSFTRVGATITTPAGTWDEMRFYLYVRDATGTYFFTDVKVEEGDRVSPDWTPAPEDVWGTTIDRRYQPITNPKFSSGTDLTMKVKLYGDATYYDTLAWNDKGQAIKTKQWDDISLSDKQSWVFHADATGYTQVKAAGFASGAIADNTVVGVKFDGTPLTRMTTINAANQVKLINADNTLYVSLADADTGWGETYTPTPEEIKAYFLGWVMCNGTYNTKYTAKKEVIKLTITAAATATEKVTITLNGTSYPVAIATGDTTSAIATKIGAVAYAGYTTSVATNVVTFTATDNSPRIVPSYTPGDTGAAGTISVTTVGDVQVWYPVGDTNLSRSTVGGSGVPIVRSPSMIDKKILPYQILFRMTDLFAEEVDFNGILILIQGSNQVSISYPDFTPPIGTAGGTIKYATNLATVNEDTRYLLPTIQRRIQSAEEKITDESIIHVVTDSVEYQTTLATKANSSALSGYATRDELGGLADEVDVLGNAVNNIDLTPYVTTSLLEQTSNNITAQFSATGGMNLIKNSIGFSNLDFWEDFTSSKVETISDNTLDNLGFGSGFYFKPNGLNKGIIQTVSVNPGQPYTLSWYLNKLTSGADTSYRFWIQIMEDGVVTQQIASNQAETTADYQHSYMNYTPTSTSVTFRFIGYANVEAILTGVMFTIGNVPLQWTLATGEVYNTNIRLNLNGIRVSQLDANRKEIGYTLISPDEFAGYYSPNNNGVFEKIFYLNGEETVTKKLRATAEITLGTVKVLKIESTANTGWAFVSNS